MSPSSCSKHAQTHKHYIFSGRMTCPYPDTNAERLAGLSKLVNDLGYPHFLLLQVRDWTMLGNLMVGNLPHASHTALWAELELLMNTRFTNSAPCLGPMVRMSNGNCLSVHLTIVSCVQQPPRSSKPSIETVTCVTHTQTHTHTYTHTHTHTHTHTQTHTRTHTHKHTHTHTNKHTNTHEHTHTHTHTGGDAAIGRHPFLPWVHTSSVCSNAPL